MEKRKSIKSGTYIPHGSSSLSFSKRLQAEPDLPLYRACEIYNALIKFLSGRLSRLIRPPAHLHRLLACSLACFMKEAANCTGPGILETIIRRIIFERDGNRFRIDARHAVELLFLFFFRFVFFFFLTLFQGRSNSFDDSEGCSRDCSPCRCPACTPNGELDGTGERDNRRDVNKNGHGSKFTCRE